MCFITVYVRMISYNISRYLFNQLQNKTNHYGLKLNTGNNHNNQEKKSVRVGLHYESPKCLGCSYTSLQQITSQLNQFCVYLLLCPVVCFFSPVEQPTSTLYCGTEVFYAFLKRHNFSVGRSARADDVSLVATDFQDRMWQTGTAGRKDKYTIPLYTRQHGPLFFSKNSDFKFQENVNKICTIYP